MFFDWSDDYLIHVESLDAQHQKIFMMVKVLHGYIESGQTQLVMKKFVVELINYTETHFSDEEKYMREIKVPDRFLQEEIEEHKELIRQVKDIETEFALRHKVCSQKLISFLVGWLKNHIVRLDKQIGEFALEKSAKK